MPLTYTTLTGAKTVEGSIRQLVNHADVPATLILIEAEAWIYNRLRVFEMRAADRWAASSGDEGFALPEGFIDNISVRVDGGSGLGLEYKHEEVVDVARDEDGVLEQAAWPSFYYLMDNAYQFGIQLTEDREGDLWFYKFPDALAASTNETNFLTLKYPTLLTNVCRAFGFRHRQRIDDYLAELKLAMNEINEANTVGQARRGLSF